MDSDSNVTMFNNQNYITDIKTGNANINVDANGKGRITSQTTCKISGLDCEAYFNVNSMSNIISLADMIDSFKVTMDTSVDKVFFVHLPDKIVRLGLLPNRLFGLDLNSKEHKHKNYSMQEHNKLFNKGHKSYKNSQTVKKNLKFLSEAQQIRAKKARRVM